MPRPLCLALVICTPFLFGLYLQFPSDARIPFLIPMTIIMFFFARALAQLWKAD